MINAMNMTSNDGVATRVRVRHIRLFTMLIVTMIIVLTMLASKVTAGKDYYAILGVDRNADKSAIRSSYRKLSIMHHPDKNKDDSSAAERFADVSEAYEVLSDDEKRSMYDQFGEEGVRRAAGGKPMFHNPFDIFSQFGGGGFPFGDMFGHHQGQPKGANVMLPLVVTLEELYTGTDVLVDINKHVLCPVCRGTGGEDPDSREQCPACHGQGHTIIEKMLGPFMQRVRATCERCSGKGTIVRGVCKSCHGRCVRRGSRTLSVTVPEGSAAGDPLIVEGGADEAPDTDPGDLVFVVEETSQEGLERRGANLHATVHVPLRDALLGFQRTVNVFSQLAVDVDRHNGTTPPGTTVRFEGQGMPIRREKRKPGDAASGDLFVRFEVDFPPVLSSEQRSIVESLF